MAHPLSCLLALLMCTHMSTGKPADPNSLGSFDLILQANLELEVQKNQSSPPLPDDVFEGDLALTEEQRRNIDLFGDVTSGRAGDGNTKIRWPGGVIPYEIDCSLHNMADAMGAIKAAIAEWEKATCLRFVKRTNEKDYLWFFRQKGCWCNVGRIGGKTRLSVGYGCEFQHVMTHEIGHAVGFWHEQSRPDRDSYVQVMRQNILPGFESAFAKYGRDRINSQGIAYDYGSIMHYPFNAFSKNGQPTLKTLRPMNSKRPYQKLSYDDAVQTNRMYNNCKKPSSGRRGKRSMEKSTKNMNPLVSGRQKRAACSDTDWRCSGWRRWCRSNRAVRNKCRKTCGLCRVTTGCRDFNRNCQSWKRRGECRRNPRYMNRYCRRSCGICRPRPPTQRPRPPTPRPRPPTPRPRPPTPRPRPPTPRPRPPTRRPRPPTARPPSGDVCGVRAYGRNHGRVVNGQTAAKNSWPWQAQLRSRSTGSHFCGGSLVAKQWVLTAAHCVRGKHRSQISIRLGEHQLRLADGTEQDFSVSQVIVHPSYIRRTADSDVALLKLDRPARLNKAVRLICLPRHGVSAPVGKHCYISGWGRTGYNRPGAVVLQEAKMPIANQRTCASAMRSWGTVTRRMICSGFGGSSTVSGCFGDSGGPFVCQGANRKWTLEGAVSWGTRTCSAGRNQYTVYARISEFIPWIRKYIGADVKPPIKTSPPPTPPRPDTPPPVTEVTPPRPQTPPPATDATPPKPQTPPPVTENTPPKPQTPGPVTTAGPPRPPTPRPTTTKPTQCSDPRPLGLESKEIPDSSLSASSSYNRWHSPREARLNLKPGATGVGAWCAAGPLSVDEYLEVDLGFRHAITHVATQGRVSKYPKFVKSYFIHYSDNGNSWSRHPTKFRGNIDMDTVTKNSVVPPITARYIRINPTTWHSSICLRAELYGCPVTPPATPPTKPPVPTTHPTPPLSTTKAPLPPTDGPKPPVVTDPKPPEPATTQPPTKPVVTIPPKPIGIKCADYHTSCPTWAKSNRCNEHYVKQNCLKSCRSSFCDWEQVRPNAPCSNPMGLGWDRRLPDSAFTASSELNLGTWDASARNARLYHVDSHDSKRVGGWCAASRDNQWLQVDLGRAQYITAVATQGRSKYFETVNTYTLVTSTDGVNWEDVMENMKTKIFQGNCDHFTPVVNRLPRGVTARYIRFMPKTSSYPCMRVEVFGC